VQIFGETYACHNKEVGIQLLNKKGSEVFQRKLACYFNLGLDARIAYEAEMMPRKASRVLNKWRYVQASVQQFVFNYSPPKLSEYLESITETPFQGS